MAIDSPALSARAQAPRVGDSLPARAASGRALPLEDPLGVALARDATVPLEGDLGEREPAVRVLPSGAEITLVATDVPGDNALGLSTTAGEASSPPRPR